MSLVVPDGDGTPIMPPQAGQQGADIVLPVPYISQRPSSNLCWAACGAMLLAAEGLPHGTLCEVASLLSLNGANCCPTPSGTNCDHAADPAAALDYFKLHYQSQIGHLDPESIRGWITSARKPIQVYYWLDGHPGHQRAHVVLLIGYSASGQIFVNDPWYGWGWVEYGDVHHCYGYGSWYESYYGIGDSLGPLPPIA